MTIQELRARKKELGYSNEMVAKLSGIPLGTVIKVFSGATKAPRSRTLQALEAVLAPKAFRCSEYEMPALMFRETAAAYGSAAEKPVRHTVEDYYRLPDDIRCELIDGTFYDLAAPSYNHQFILMEISGQFRECQKKHPGNCRVVFAPCDVQLDKDNYTIVQPDLLVICDQEKIRERVCYGAPDLTLEIMSPSSRSLDSVLKLNKYRNAGVREYWLVDPENRKVIVYDFENGDHFQIYSFTDKIPVGISGGSCEIDFAEVEKMIMDHSGLNRFF